MAHQHDLDPLAPQFSVRVVSTGRRAARVLVTGELDLATSPQLDETLTEVLAETEEVVLDLSGVTFIDSTGLSTILVGISSSKLNGGTLKISSMLTPQAQRLFELAGMERTLPLVDE